MPTVEALEERVDSLEVLLQQALERSMRHGDEHWEEGSDPAPNRWQVSSGVPTHVAEEGTPYWDTASNNAYVNNNGLTGWTQLTTGSVSGDHTILTGPSGTHTDTASAVTLSAGDMQVANDGATKLWDRLALDGSGHGEHAVLGKATTSAALPSWVDRSIHSVGPLESVTISSGSITITRSHVAVSPQGGVADDLDNIDAAAAVLGSGHIMFLFNAHATVTITLKNLTGTGPKRLFFPDLKDVALLPSTGIWMVSEAAAWTPAAPAYHSKYTDAEARTATKYAIYIPLGSDTLGETAPP